MIAARVPFTIKVEFKSDWFIGTGSGRHASVDAATFRDHDGLPALRGKALTGMLRDSAESIARAFDAGGEDTWAQWVVALFGSQPGLTGNSAQSVAVATGLRTGAPVPAALIGSTLRIEEAGRTVLTGTVIGSRHLADGLFRARPGVKLDENRVASEDMLRMIEVAAGGLVLQAEWHVDFPGITDGAPLPAPAEILLLGAAALTERIGGKRRRGLGRCAVEVLRDAGAGGAVLAELLQSVDVGKVEAPTPALWAPNVGGGHASRVRSNSAADQPTSTMPGLAHVADLRITLRSPLIVDAGTQGNLVRSMDFVPGSMLLPIVCKALGSRCSELIADGRLRVSDAYIEIDGHRGLPAPRCWQIEKGSELAPESKIVVVTHPDAERVERPKPLASQYVSIVRVKVHSDSQPTGVVDLARPALVERVHAVITDSVQRPTEDDAGLFIYQGIAPGTVLRCEVHLPAGEISLDDLRASIGTTERIGRSRKDEYGSVDVAVLEPAPVVADIGEPPASGFANDGGASPTHPTADVVVALDSLLVYLASDALLVGPFGDPAPTPDALADELSRRLGAPLRVPAAQSGEVAQDILTTVRRRESWQTRWNLPRTSLVAMAAGSVIRLEAPGGLPSSGQLAEVERSGVGQRRAEGFGDVRLNPWMLGCPSVTVRQVNQPVKARSAELGEIPAQWRSLARPMWLDEIEHAAVRCAEDRDILRTFIPESASNSQVGTLRQLAAGSTAEVAVRSRIKGWAARTAHEHTPQTGDGRWHGWETQLQALWELCHHARAIYQRLGLDPGPALRDQLRGTAIGAFLRALARAHTRTTDSRDGS